MLVTTVIYSNDEKRYIRKEISINKIKPDYYITILDIIEYPVYKDDLTNAIKSRYIFYLSNKDRNLINRYLNSLGCVKDLKTGIWYIEKKTKNKKRKK